MYETNGNQGGGGRSGPWPEEDVEGWRAQMNPRFRVGRPPQLTPAQLALV
jgi:hypothetical protein